MKTETGLRIAVVTVSDRSARGERPDLSGPAVAEAVKAQGWVVVEAVTLPDEYEQLKQYLAATCDRGDVDILITTGGTGFAPRDITPEATQAVIHRSAPGIGEAMRSASLQVTPHAMISRSTAGIRGKTIIVNLPGSPKAAVENLQVILGVLPHAVQLLNEDPRSEAGH